MLEIGLIIVLTMAAVEIVKRLLKVVLSEEWVAVLLPFVIIVSASLLNLANMAVFDPSIGWRDAIKVGIAEGAAAAGIYSVVKNAVQKLS